ncbi:MAG: DUF748 domain-containing protein [Verrucomicrobiota bacterium]
MKALLQLMKQRKITTTIIGLFIFYNLVGFLIVPWLMRSVIPGQISERFLNGEILIERAVVNPYTFAGRVEVVTVKDAEGITVAAVDRAVANFDPLRSLFGWRFAFAEVEVNAPSVDATLLEDASLSLLSLLKPREAKEPDPEASLSLPLLVVDAFTLVDGQLSLTDEWLGDGFSEEVFNINVSATGFSTDPESNNLMTASAETANGAKMRWDGAIQFDPLSSTGTVHMEDFRSDAYEPYYRKLFAADLSTEGLNVSMDYVLAPADEEPKIRISDTRIEQAEVALKEPDGGRTLMSAQRIVMDGIAVDFIVGTASMSRLVVDGETFFAARYKDNEINLLKHLLPKGFESGDFQPGQDKEPVPEAPEPVPPEELIADQQKDILYAIQRAVAYLQSIIELAWQVDMDYLEIKNREIELRDENLVTPALLVIESFDLLVTELSNREGEDAQIELSLNVRGGGRIEVSGTVTPFPTTMQLNYKIEEIDLSVISPYLQTLNQSKLQSGRFHTEGELFVDFSKFIEMRELPELQIKGSFGIDTFALLQTTGESSQTILSWESLEVRNYLATTEPEHKLQLEEVMLTSPYAYVEVLKDGTLSWQQLIPEALAGEVPRDESIDRAQPGAATPEQPLYAMEIRLPVAVDVATVTVENGSFELKDQFYGPGFQTKWEGLSVRIHPLTTQGETPIQIEASGRQANGSQFTSTIALTNPLLVERQIETTFATDVLATPFSPYSAQVVGFLVEEGRVAVDADFSLSQDTVNARVKIDMDQFTLGDKAEVDEVMLKLPVKLAISLMKDREGKIDLPEVKVDGSLKDPDFNVAEVVVGVLVNIITNAATKPFAFIAGAFGGDAEDLERVTFKPGSAVFPATQTQKLEVLAEALFKRPNLSLLIEGYTDPAAETPAVKRSLLAAELQQFKGIPPSDAVRILYHDRLPEAFAQYQTEAKAAAAAAQPEPVDAPNDPEVEEQVDDSTPSKAPLWRVDRHVIGFLGREQADVAVPPVASDSAPTEPTETSSVAPAPAEPSPWATHIALTDTSFFFPQAAAMEAALMETIEVPETFWPELAASRSASVQEALLVVRELAAERVSIALPEPSEEVPAMIGVRFQLQ